MNRKHSNMATLMDRLTEGNPLLGFYFIQFHVTSSLDKLVFSRQLIEKWRANLSSSDTVGEGCQSHQVSFKDF